jgi:hypothetical protein
MDANDDDDAGDDGNNYSFILLNMTAYVSDH